MFGKPERNFHIFLVELDEAYQDLNLDIVILAFGDQIILPSAAQLKKFEAYRKEQAAANVNEESDDQVEEDKEEVEEEEEVSTKGKKRALSEEEKESGPSVKKATKMVEEENLHTSRPRYLTPPPSSSKVPGGSKTFILAREGSPTPAAANSSQSSQSQASTSRLSMTLNFDEVPATYEDALVMLNKMKAELARSRTRDEINRGEISVLRARIE